VPAGGDPRALTAKLEEALEEAVDEHATAKRQFCDFVTRAGDEVPSWPK
jgi:hypothetical protein